MEKFNSNIEEIKSRSPEIKSPGSEDGFPSRSLYNSDEVLIISNQTREELEDRDEIPRPVSGTGKSKNIPYVTSYQGDSDRVDVYVPIGNPTPHAELHKEDTLPPNILESHGPDIQIYQNPYNPDYLYYENLEAYAAVPPTVVQATPNNPPVSQLIIIDNAPPIFQGTDLMQEKTLNYSGCARYMVLLEFFLIFFYAIAAPMLIFLAIFPIIGYFGARNFNRCVCYFYCCFLILAIISKIVLIVENPKSFVIIIFVILIAYEIGEAVLYVILIKLLNRFSTNERNHIIEKSKLSPPNLCGWRI